MTLQYGIIGLLLSLDLFRLNHLHLHSTAKLHQSTNTETIKKLKIFPFALNK